MSEYVSGTSDKLKKTALIVWAVGGLGFLGLENFYVGNIKNGIIHLLLGLLAFLAISNMTGDEMFLPVTLIFWAVFAAPNLVRLLLGTFRDNVGAPLRK